MTTNPLDNVPGFWPGRKVERDNRISEFWTGSTGLDYAARNAIEQKQIDARVDMWNELLCHMHDPKTILEVGANIGQNLVALSKTTQATLYATEPNAEARDQLIDITQNVTDDWADNLSHKSGSMNLVFTSGVLIHIPPEKLLQSCAEMFRVSKRYIVSIEYFSADPEMKTYRGEENKMWKRDFGKFWLDNFQLKPLTCNFFWKETTGLDNLTAWAFEKW